MLQAIIKLLIGAAKWVAQKLDSPYFSNLLPILGKAKKVFVTYVFPTFALVVAFYSSAFALLMIINTFVYPSIFDLLTSIFGLDFFSILRIDQHFLSDLNLVPSSEEFGGISNKDARISSQQSNAEIVLPGTISTKGPELQSSVVDTPAVVAGVLTGIIVGVVTFVYLYYFF